MIIRNRKSGYYGVAVVVDGGCWLLWCTCKDTSTLKLVRSKGPLRFILKWEGVQEFMVDIYIYNLWLVSIFINFQVTCECMCFYCCTHIAQRLSDRLIAWGAQIGFERLIWCFTALCWHNWFVDAYERLISLYRGFLLSLEWRKTCICTFKWARAL